jgi:hypothetical protein
MVALEMTDAGQTEYLRLYRKAARMKFVLLVLASLVNWALWTTIQAGNQKLPAIEDRIRTESINFIKKWGIDDTNTIQTDKRDPNNIYGLIPRVQMPFWTEHKPLDKFAEFMNDQRNMESWFDQERLEAYRVPIRLPYLETSLGMNVLLAVDYWPFGLIAIIAVIIVIGMRERVNAQMLSWQSFLKPSSLDPAELLIKSDFRIGRLEELSEGDRKVLVYKRPFIIYPESALSFILWIGIAYSSFQMMSVYDPTHNHQVGDILTDYYAGVWFFTWVAIFFLWLTQRFYSEKLHEVFGKQSRARFTHSGLVLVDSVRCWMRRAKWRLRAYRICDILIALAAISSLFLPWIIEGGTRGFRFLLEQNTVPYEYGEPGHTIRLFPIEPTIFNELRTQLQLAVGFITACLVCSCIWGVLSERWRSYFSRFRLFVGTAVLLLAGNFVFHLLALDLQSQSYNGIPGVQFISPNVGTFSYSLMYLDPTYGLWIFISLCILLTFLSQFYRSMVTARREAE